MTVLLLLLGHALAGGLPPWPQVKKTVPGECDKTIGITKGPPIPLLSDQGALARCSFIAEPLSSYAHLLAIEVHAKQVRDLYTVDTQLLIQERDHWRRKAGQATVWHRRPWFVAVTTSALVSGLYVTYALSNGERR